MSLEEQIRREIREKEEEIKGLKEEIQKLIAKLEMNDLEKRMQKEPRVFYIGINANKYGELIVENNTPYSTTHLNQLKEYNMPNLQIIKTLEVLDENS